MAKLPRTTQKIFGKNAPENQITTFGSIKAGTPVYTQSASQIMNSAFEGGWSEAVEDDYAPYRQDRNAVDTAITQQLGYLFQDGIPEWDSGTTYYKGSVVKVVNGNALTFYKSIADNNTSSVSTANKWHKMLDINASNQIVSPSINTPTISGGSMSSGTFSDPTFSGTVNVPLASQSSSTDSTIAASIGWVNNPNLSSNVVHKIGNETIGGTKTFTATPRIYEPSPTIIFKDSDLIKGTAPSSNNDSSLFYWDKNNAIYGAIRYRVEAGLNSYLRLETFKQSSTSNAYTNCTVMYQADGKYYLNFGNALNADSGDSNESLSAVTNSISNTTVPCMGWVNNPATSTNVVHRSGNETIGGEKTLTSNLNIQKGNPNIYLKNTSITKGTTPSSVHYSWYGTIFDSQGIVQENKMSQIFTTYYPSGVHRLDMSIFKPESGSTTVSSLAIGYDANGNVFTEAPTPATSDNSTNIATTAYVKAQGYASDSDVVKTTGDQTVGGTKTFTKNIIISKNGPIIHQKNTNITKGTAPSSNVNNHSISYQDNNNKSVGELIYQYDTNKNVQARLCAYKSSASTDTADTYLRVYYNANGHYGVSLASENVGSDTNDSLVNNTTSTTNPTLACMGWVNSRISSVMTTSGAGLATFDKSPNGYIKFANGIIMQWGQATTTGSTTTITYPVPFTSSTSYALTDVGTYGGTTGAGHNHIKTGTQTSTGCQVIIDSTMNPTNWIAIGY